MYGPSTSLSGTVDAAFAFIVGVSLFFLVLVTALMIVFAVRYRRSRHPHASQVSGNLPLEILWTVVPVGLVLAMFYYGFAGFEAIRHTPADATIVQVTGRMWKWSFRYENGKETGRLYVPVGRPVKLVMRSMDVIHSFYIPAFRLKEDVVPGRETYLWFKPQSTGPTDIFCAEFCGEQHAYMMSEVIVLPEDEYAAWYASRAGEAEGRSAVALLDEQGCLACHSLDGSLRTGPTFKAIYGRRETVIRDGREHDIVVDEPHLRRAILEPGAETVKGYPATMPAVEMNDEDLQAILGYLETLD